jgi:hypothetical protein
MIRRLFQQRPKGLRPELLRYLETLPGLAGDESMSEFWRRRIARFDELAGEAPGSEADALERVVGSDYGFDDLPKGVGSVDRDPLFIDSRDVWARIEAAGKVRREALAGIDKDLWEHARVLGFLEREKLLDEYTEFLAPLRIRSSMATARHWYYARLVHGLCEQHLGRGRLDVLEIGGGAGNLAYFLSVLGRVRSYTIVDLPEMLAHSGFTLSRRLPRSSLVFPPSPAGTARAGEYRFVTPAEAQELPESAFDVALNFNSFMEMDRHVRDAYFDLVYRVGRPGGLFVNVNRRQRVLPLANGETWDNNPLLYPYRDDEVIAWEEERFQTTTRADFNFATSLAVLRAGIIRPQRSSMSSRSPT